MITNRLGICLLICVALFFCPAIAAKMPDDMLFVTEEYPPFSYLENGVPSGLSIELLQTALERAGIHLPSDDIQLMAWTDAYNTALQKKHRDFFHCKNSGS